MRWDRDGNRGGPAHHPRPARPPAPTLPFADDLERLIRAGDHHALLGWRDELLVVLRSGTLRAEQAPDASRLLRRVDDALAAPLVAGRVHGPRKPQKPLAERVADARSALSGTTQDPDLRSRIEAAKSALSES